MISKPTYQTVSEIASHFNVSSRELNKVFSDLGWAQKEERWWIATKEGIKQGASQEYNPRNKQKFIKWDTKIKDNKVLIDKIHLLKRTDEKCIEVLEKVTEQKEFQKTSYAEKVIKGKAYEEHVAKHYEQLGYYVWEHGKDKGRKDHGIDLIAKKDKEIIFMQCKNWDKSTSYKIDHKDLKSTRQDVRDYIDKNPIFQHYTQRVVYVLSNDVLHKSAHYYLEEHQESIECQIIPF